jgi:2-amino-4-hydroxy-6-hydroxymethyldihydropteridine diphosphokinase
MSGRRSVRAYLGLGANLGDAAATLAWAVGAIDDGQAQRVAGVSRLYATAPWGAPDQPEFRNAVVALDLTSSSTETPETSALGLLGRLKTIERAAGRRPGPRWGPRPLDLDILVFGRHRISVERSGAGSSIDAPLDAAKTARRLEVPHRDLGARLFVLAPLADIAPRLVPPGWIETVETRRRHVAATEPLDVVRVVGTWDAAVGRWTLAALPA